MLVLAPSSLFLIVAGILQGFFFIYLTVAGAMNVELVPPEHMGRWLGVMRFFRLLLAAGVAYLAGAIWDHVGPQYVFLIAIGLDACIRIPLLIGMPETLELSIGEKQKKEGRNTSLKCQIRREEMNEKTTSFFSYGKGKLKG